MSTSWSQRPLLLELNTPPSRRHGVVGRTREGCGRRATFEAVWPREGEGIELMAREALPFFMVKSKPEAVSSSSLEEVGATAAFSGIWLAIFAFVASINKSSLLKRANFLFAKKTREKLVTLRKQKIYSLRLKEKKCIGVTL